MGVTHLVKLKMGGVALGHHQHVFCYAPTLLLIQGSNVTMETLSQEMAAPPTALWNLILPASMTLLLLSVTHVGMVISILPKRSVMIIIPIQEMGAQINVRSKMGTSVPL